MHSGVVNVVGVQFTLLSAIILASTFIPKGAFKFNPHALYNENLDTELDIDGLSKPIDGEQGVINMEKEEEAGNIGLGSL